MRKLKFWIFSIIAILSLVSMRDKEIVLTIPENKPLIAEAYQKPLVQDIDIVSPSVPGGSSGILSQPQNNLPGSSFGNNIYPPDTSGDLTGSNNFTPSRSGSSGPALGSSPAAAPSSGSGSNSGSGSTGGGSDGGSVIYGFASTSLTGDGAGGDGGGVAMSSAPNNPPQIDSHIPSSSTVTIDSGS
ncbi:MAG: hypothetical protein PHI58_05000, partial [Candidatus Omnitrophica bacterium]|nr:hypothetical protein [Candidatus Omnitrophota bacterium]